MQTHFEWQGSKSSFFPLPLRVAGVCQKQTEVTEPSISYEALGLYDYSGIHYEIDTAA